MSLPQEQLQQAPFFWPVTAAVPVAASAALTDADLVAVLDFAVVAQQMHRCVVTVTVTVRRPSGSDEVAGEAQGVQLLQHLLVEGALTGVGAAEGGSVAVVTGSAACHSVHAGADQH